MRTGFRHWGTAPGRGEARLLGLLVVAVLVLAGCGGQAVGGPAGGWSTIAPLPAGVGGAGAGGGPAKPLKTTYPRNVLTADLGDTSPTQMFIHLSSPTVTAGKVTFLITNSSTDMKHELVGFQTKTPAADYPIAGFEGDPNRIDEDTAGPVVLDTGAALDPGATQMVSVNLKPGHYALVCNLPGHYKAGMHVDLWAA
jgi:uncharacterized cupredoxin-like copper-binding protein